MDPMNTLNTTPLLVSLEIPRMPWAYFIISVELHGAQIQVQILETDLSYPFRLPLSQTVPRMQFYAYEIARNRQGVNDWIRAAAAAEAEKAKESEVSS